MIIFLLLCGIAIVRCYNAHDSRNMFKLNNDALQLHWNKKSEIVTIRTAKGIICLNKNMQDISSQCARDLKQGTCPEIPVKCPSELNPNVSVLAALSELEIADCRSKRKFKCVMHERDGFRVYNLAMNPTEKSKCSTKYYSNGNIDEVSLKEIYSKTIYNYISKSMTGRSYLQENGAEINVILRQEREDGQLKNFYFVTKSNTITFVHGFVHGTFVYVLFTSKNRKEVETKVFRLCVNDHSLFSYSVATIVCSNKTKSVLYTSASSAYFRGKNITSPSGEPTDDSEVLYVNLMRSRDTSTVEKEPKSVLCMFTLNRIEKHFGRFDIDNLITGPTACHFPNFPLAFPSLNMDTA